MVEKHNSSSGIISVVNFMGRQLVFAIRNTAFSLFLIGVMAVFLRLYYFPYGVPITLDGIVYFWYAIDISILGRFPTGYTFANNGWPTFLSIFFSIFHSNNFMDYMTLQRLVAVSLSVLTIVPVYLLCRRFFDKSYAIVGAALFVFEPHIIQNSLLGITEPLYIILITSALVLFLSSQKKLIYTSFAVLGYSALVRAEALFLFIPFSIVFFIRFRREAKVIPKYAIAASIFIALLIPMAIIRIQTTEHNDALIGRVSNEAAHVLSSIPKDDKSNLFLYWINGLKNPLRFLGWSMIPYFVLLVPLGAFSIFRNRNHNHITIILSIIFSIIPAFYALSQASDTRYLFPMYPLFCILSLFTVRMLRERLRNRNVLLMLLIASIITSSAIFLDLKKNDVEHEKEAFDISQYVAKNTKVINEYYPEGKYLAVTRMINLQNFPVLKTSILPGVKILPIYGFDSLSEYIEFGRKEGLTHLLVDGAKRNPPFLNDVFNDDTKYSYLTKEFDSWDYGYKYHVKIYKIDYAKFDSMQTKG